MKPSVVVFFFLIAFSVRAQRENAWFELSTINNDPDYPFQPEKRLEGICFVVPATDFQLYKRPLVINEPGAQLVRIEFSESQGLTTTFRGKTTATGDTTSLFHPWMFNDDPNNFALALECTDTSGAFYRVRLNDSDIGFISKRNTDFRKISFENFVKQWTKAGFDFDRNKNPLRKMISETGEIIRHADQEKYAIWPAKTLDVKNDWMKVKTIKGEEGWIRWKNADNVLIRMYFQFQN